MEKYGNTLALDCATLMGWAVAIEGTLTEYGETRLKRGEIDLWGFLTDITAKHHITRIVAENIFLDKNVRTFERLANYHGVIHLFSQLHNIELITKGYQPTEWKRILIRDAYATKEEVKNYVNKLLGKHIQSDNTTDAIGILLTWTRRQRR
jgi:crossover junction endodeoxyribonuclease ruvC